MQHERQASTDYPTLERKLSPMRSKTQYEEALLRAQVLHHGVYLRVANKLSIDPSLVSRVAAGKRQDEKIRGAILDELRKIQSLLQ